MSVFQTIDPRRIPVSIAPENTLLVFRERILQYILIGASLLGGLTYLSAVIPGIQNKQWALVILYTLVFAGVIAITWLRKISFHIRAGGLVVILYVLGVSGLLESGLVGDGRIFLMLFTIMCAVFLGMRLGIYADILSAVTLGAIGSLMVGGTIAPAAAESMASIGSTTDWTTSVVVFITATVMASGSIFLLMSGLEQAIEKERGLTNDLIQERTSLEARVEERTLALERRATELEAASRLARDITQSSELDELLNRSAEIIRSQFGFYHVGIFLMDEKKEYAVLKAASGNAGKVMIERGHRLMAGEVGIVGLVVSQGQARITEDVEKDRFHFKNPLLPNTQSEMAIPLRIGDTIIGALDVQSETAGTFGQQDINILQVIGDQLAVAIEKARLVEQLRNSLQEVQSKAGDETQKTWLTHLSETRQEHTYRYRRDGMDPTSKQSIEARQAFSTGEVVIGGAIPTQGAGKRELAVAIPIRLREQVIGVLDVHFEEEALTHDRIELLETTAARMSLALENARLMETIQLRAQQEHMVSEISAKVRSSADIDSILRTAAQELGRSLGISEVTVQLRPGK